jgi:hypothetical protein
LEVEMPAKSIAVVMLLACACFFACSSKDDGAGSVLSLDGTAVMFPVDERRVLVGMDSSNSGKVEHLFLYTGSEAIDLGTLGGRFPAHVEFKEGALAVVEKDGGARLEFIVEGQPGFETAPDSAEQFPGAIGLSHYEGKKLTLDGLMSIREAESCDHAPGSCYEADGVEILFPA